MEEHFGLFFVVSFTIFVLYIFTAMELLAADQ